MGPIVNCWRGVGRVVGHEGKSTVWVSRRGILLAVSPEQLSLAVDDEIQQWLIDAKETELIDAMPAAGGTGFLDLRRAPKPDPMPLQNEEEPQPFALDREMPYSPSEAPSLIEEMPAVDAPAEAEPDDAAPPEPAPEVEDLSSTSTSMARMRSQKEMSNDRSRAVSFSRRMSAERERLREKKRQRVLGLEPSPPPVSIPAGPEFDPDLDDYHTPPPAAGVSPPMETITEDDPSEAAEREAKRLRIGSKEASSFTSEGLLAFMAVETPGFLVQQASQQFQRHAAFYSAKDVSAKQFLFGVRRNDFHHAYQQLCESALESNLAPVPGVAKKGRKELRLTELTRSPNTSEKLTNPSAVQLQSFHSSPAGHNDTSPHGSSAPCGTAMSGYSACKRQSMTKHKSPFTWPKP